MDCSLLNDPRVRLKSMCSKTDIPCLVEEYNDATRTLKARGGLKKKTPFLQQTIESFHKENPDIHWTDSYNKQGDRIISYREVYIIHSVIRECAMNGDCPSYMSQANAKTNLQAAESLFIDHLNQAVLGQDLRALMDQNGVKDYEALGLESSPRHPEFPGWILNCMALKEGDDLFAKEEKPSAKDSGGDSSWGQESRPWKQACNDWMTGSDCIGGQVHSDSDASSALSQYGGLIYQQIGAESLKLYAKNFAETLTYLNPEIFKDKKKMADLSRRFKSEARCLKKFDRETFDSVVATFDSEIGSVMEGESYDAYLKARDSIRKSQARSLISLSQRMEVQTDRLLRQQAMLADMWDKVRFGMGDQKGCGLFTATEWYDGSRYYQHSPECGRALVAVKRFEAEIVGQTLRELTATADQIHTLNIPIGGTRYGDASCSRELIKIYKKKALMNLNPITALPEAVDSSVRLYRASKEGWDGLTHGLWHEPEYQEASFDPECGTPLWRILNRGTPQAAPQVTPLDSETWTEWLSRSDSVHNSILASLRHPVAQARTKNEEEYIARLEASRYQMRFDPSHDDVGTRILAEIFAESELVEKENAAIAALPESTPAQIQSASDLYDLGLKVSSDLSFEEFGKACSPGGLENLGKKNLTNDAIGMALYINNPELMQNASWLYCFAYNQEKEKKEAWSEFLIAGGIGSAGVSMGGYYSFMSTGNPLSLLVALGGSASEGVFLVLSHEDSIAQAYQLAADQALGVGSYQDVAQASEALKSARLMFAVGTVGVVLGAAPNVFAAGSEAIRLGSRVALATERTVGAAARAAGLATRLGRRFPALTTYLEDLSKWEAYVNSSTFKGLSHEEQALALAQWEKYMSASRSNAVKLAKQEFKQWLFEKITRLKGREGSSLWKFLSEADQVPDETLIKFMNSGIDEGKFLDDLARCK